MEIVGNSDSLSRTLDRASASASSFGSRISGAMRLAGRATEVGALAMGTGIGYAIHQAANFQDQLNTFQVVSQSSGAEMKKVSALARKLGADITLPATSASDAAAAMTELAKAGLKTSDVMKAAKGVLQLSAAAEISNADAAQIVANNLNAFGLAGDKATHIADLLAASSIAASGSMTDMAESLTMTAATAAQAHMPIEDVVAAIGEMANKGIIGSQSGAALQQMLLKLEKPSKAGADAMKHLGVNVYDAHGAMLPMPALIDEFSKATEGMSQKQRDAAMNAIFGSRAIRAANIVLLGGKDAYDTMRNSVERQGAAADVAKAKMKGFHGALQALQSSVETLAIDLGTPLLQPLAAAAGVLANFVNKVDGAKTFHAKINVVWDGLENVGDSLWNKIFGNGGSTIATHNTSGAGLNKGIAAAVESAIASIDWTAAWGKARGMGAGLAHSFQNIDWSTVGTTIGNGFSAAVDKALSGSTGLPSAFEKSFRSINWEQLGRAAGPGLAAAVATAFVTLTDPGFWIRNWDLALAIGLTVFGGAIGKVAGRFAAPLVRLMDEGLMKMLPAIERFSPRLAGALLAIILRLPGIVSRGFDALSSLVGKLFSKLGGVTKFTVKVLGVQAAIDAVAHMATAIYNKGKDIVDWFKSLPGKITAALGDLSHLLWDAGVQIIKGFLGGLESKFHDVTNFFHKLTAHIPKVKGPESTDIVLLYGAGRTIIQGFINGLESRYKDVNKSLKGFGSALAIDASIQNASRFIGLKQAEAVAAGFIQGTPTLAQQIRQGLHDAIDKAKQAVLDSRTSFVSAFDSLAQASLQAFDERIAKWVPPALKILDKMQLQDQVDQAKQAITDAQAQIVKAQSDLTAALQEVATAKPKDGESDADFQTRLAGLQANAAAAYQQEVAAEKALGDAKRAQTELNLQLEAQQQQQAHDKRMAKQREHLAEQLGALQRDLAKHPEEWRKANEKIMALLKKYDVPMFQAGQRFASKFADGLRSGISAVAKAAHDLADALDKYVPHSPARTGPLSKYDAFDAGHKFGSKFATGIGTGLYSGQGLGTITPRIASAGAGIGGGAGLGTSTRSQINIELSLPNYLGDRTEVVGWIRDELTQMGRRDPNIFGGYA